MTLLARLNTLEATGLIALLHAEPEIEYLFRHALVQEAAYTSLLKESRRRLHQAVAEALEQTYPDRVASQEIAALLAYHFDRADESARAMRYYTLAGDAASRLYANTEAIAHYSRALELATRQPDVSAAELQHLYLRRGRALELNSRFDEALAGYEALEALAQQRGDRSLELAALIARTTIYAIPGPHFDTARGAQLGEQALSLARRAADRAAQAKILWIRMLSSFFSGQLDQTLDYGEQSLAIARELNLREQLAYTLSDLGNYGYMMSGRVDQGMAAVSEARSIWRELNNLPMLTDNLSTTALVHHHAGEFDAALELANEAHEISRRIGNRWGQAYSQGVRGYVFMERGEIDHALAALNEAIEFGHESFIVVKVVAGSLVSTIYRLLGAFDRSLEISRATVALGETQSTFWLAQALGSLARLQIDQGEYDQAAATIARASKALTPANRFTYSYLLNMAECELALARAHYADAIEKADGAIEGLRQRRGYTLVPYMLCYKGAALAALNRIDEAQQVLTEALRQAQTLGARHSWCRALIALADVHERRSQFDEAQRVRKEAAEIIGFIADHISDAELRESFLHLPDVRGLIK
jgi:tetratricopeptide (TPR) repeat protein